MIYYVRIKPLVKSFSSIPLYRLQCLPLIPPISEVGVIRLQNEFVMAYRDGDRAMYVSFYNNLDKVLHVSNDIWASSSLLWQEANDEFDSMFQNNSDLFHLVCRNSPLLTWSFFRLSKGYKH